MLKLIEKVTLSVLSNGKTIVINNFYSYPVIRITTGNKIKDIIIDEPFRRTCVLSLPICSSPAMKALKDTGLTFEFFYP